MTESSLQPSADDQEYEGEGEGELNTTEGFMLVEVQYEHTPWGDDMWLIPGFEPANGDLGIYDFMLKEWLEVVQVEDHGQACQHVVDN